MKLINAAALGIREKTGQVVMPRLDLRESDALALAMHLVSEFKAGGFIIFGGDKESLKRATEELSSVSEIPLFFGLDAERGVGQIVSGGALFPFIMSLGAANDEGLVYEEARFIAREMKECGLNLIFAPVLDVNTNPGNPIINIRSYGSNPELVSRMGAAFIAGVQDEGVLACGKHFPGHGGVAVDSHEDMPVENRSLEQLLTCDLVPFKRAIESGVASLMTAHVAFPGIGDGNIPATISKGIINGILRADLGYKGLVITDSFRMSGINKFGDEADNSHLALDAGCDIILDPNNPSSLLGRLNDTALTGELNENTLNGSVSRIIAVKNSGLINPTPQLPVDAGMCTTLIERISRSSVCLLKGEKLRSRKAFVFVIDVTQSGEDISNGFTDCLAEAGIDFKTTHTTFTTRLDNLIDRSKHAESVICLIYTTVGAWKKQSNLPEYSRSIFRELEAISAQKVLVSFGSPYVVSGLDWFDTVICAFDSLYACQSAAAEVLLGSIGAKGIMPVDIGF
jgi:beta-N-acetylhexosaminidase